jgi:hypothetical protein
MRCDRSQAEPFGVELDDLGYDVVGRCAGSFEVLTSCLGGGEGFAGALGDNVSLPLRDLSHEARDQLPVRSARVHAEVEQHDVPALLLGEAERVREVHD